jgi:hypothetical protein
LYKTLQEGAIVYGQDGVTRWERYYNSGDDKHHFRKVE